VGESAYLKRKKKGGTNWTQEEYKGSEVRRSIRSQPGRTTNRHTRGGGEIVCTDVGKKGKFQQNARKKRGGVCQAKTKRKKNQETHRHQGFNCIVDLLGEDGEGSISSTNRE